MAGIGPSDSVARMIIRPRIVPFLLSLIAGRSAFAQVDVTPVQPVLPAAPPADPDPAGYLSRVTGRKPSPVWTQDRNFSTTRFWLLDPGSVALETWAWARVYPNGPDGAADPASIRFFQEVSWGVAPHLQIDLYGEFHLDAQTDVTTGKDNASRYLSYEGWRAELRIAIPSHYGQIPLNPVLYLEWMSFPHDPNRAEARLLLGGQVTSWLFLAANPYFELNVTTTDKSFGKDAMGNDVTKPVYLMDAEVGTTLAAGFRITDWFNLSLQAKIGGDMLGDENNRLHFVCWAGPGFIVKPLPAKYQQYLKIIGTALFLIPGSDVNGGAGRGHDLPQQYEPTLIISSQIL